MNNPVDISDNEIHIYQTYLNKIHLEINDFRRIISQDELKKADRFKFDYDRNDYITCRAILRKILAQYLNTSPEEIYFSYTDKGKPYIEESEINFNLSHSNNHAVYAITKNTEVGIDLELLREIPDAFKIALRYFSPDETNELKSFSGEAQSMAFLNCWTRKEAFIKATGKGLSYPLSDFSVSLNPDLPEISDIKGKHGELKKWTLYNLKVEAGFIASLAVKAKDKDLVYKNL